MLVILLTHKKRTERQCSVSTLFCSITQKQVSIASGPKPWRRYHLISDGLIDISKDFLKITNCPGRRQSEIRSSLPQNIWALLKLLRTSHRPIGKRRGKEFWHTTQKLNHYSNIKRACMICNLTLSALGVRCSRVEGWTWLIQWLVTKKNLKDLTIWSQSHFKL